MKPSQETLKDLYENQRLTTRQIGERLGVSKTQIVRWMAAYGMDRRASRNGLANRGMEPPTAAELEWMLHTEHLGYREIAKRYGVDFTAVPHWVKKHGITPPTVWGTRRKGVAQKALDADDIRARYLAGESIAQIADAYGVTRSPISAFMQREGIAPRRDGWNGGHRYECKDGHLARSVYEQRVDDWLHDHGVAHTLEPAYPWDRRYMADFKVGDVYLEIWGVTDNEAYKRRKAMKEKRCKEDGLDLIGINHWQFAQGRRWWKPLERLIPKDPTRPAQQELPLP